MKHTRLLLLATALAISLTACGGSQSNTPADTPAEPETPPSVAAIDNAVAVIQEEAEQMAQTSDSITPKNPSKILPKESGEAPEAFPSSYALEADSPTEAYSKICGTSSNTVSFPARLAGRPTPTRSVPPATAMPFMTLTTTAERNCCFPFPALPMCGNTVTAVSIRN